MSSLIGLGYNLRRVEALESKVSELNGQRPSAQIQQTDIVWIKDSLARIEGRLNDHEKDNNTRLQEIEKSLRGRR
jgi:hypothetical protein